MDSIKFPIMESGTAIWHIQHPGKKIKGVVLFILVKDDVATLAPYTQSTDIMGMTSMPKGYSETLL